MKKKTYDELRKEGWSPTEAIEIIEMYPSEHEVDKTLRELWRETNDSWYEEVYNIAIEALRDKPNGEWILVCDGGSECDNLYRCSMCGVECGCEEYDKPNFCPNCGADMRIGVE